MAGLTQRLRENEETVWKWLLIAAYLGSLAGTFVVLGGLAAVTAYCWDNQPLGIGAGVKLEPPYTAFSSEVMRIQRTPVTATDGSFQCDKYFRFDWTLWSLQMVFMIIFGVIWRMGMIRRFLPGLTTLCAAVTAWHMFKTNFAIEMEQWTQGDLHTDGFVIACGLIACMIGNFSMMAVAGPYSERERQLRVSPTMGDTIGSSSEGAIKGGVNGGADYADASAGGQMV